MDLGGRGGADLGQVTSQRAFGRKLQCLRARSGRVGVVGVGVGGVWQEAAVVHSAGRRAAHRGRSLMGGHAGPNCTDVLEKTATKQKK